MRPKAKVTTSFIPIPNPAHCKCTWRRCEKGFEGNSWLSGKEHHDQLVMSAMSMGWDDGSMISAHTFHLHWD